MKILYYSPHPHLRYDAPTGYGTHIREMIGAWRSAGHEVKTLIAGDLLESGPTEVNASKLSKFKSIVPRIVWESLKDIKLVRHDMRMEKLLTKSIESLKPDLVYERVAYLQNSGVKISQKHKVQHFSEINAPYPIERVHLSGKSLFLNMGRNIERQILVESDHLFTVSSALKSHFTKIIPDLEGKITVMPNSVNASKRDVDIEKVAVLKKQYVLETTTVIGFVGSIFQYHGVDLLISAFAELENRGNAKLMIVGDGEAIPSLKALAKKLGVLGQILFTGSVPHRDVYAHIELMDICCLSRNKWYMSPVKLFEYGLLEKPVVAADVSAVRDVMDDKVALIVPDNSEDFSRALQRLIDDPALRQKLGTAWHKAVIEKHTWQKSAEKVLEKCT